jgi:hypothetical protein
MTDGMPPITIGELQDTENQIDANLAIAIAEFRTDVATLIYKENHVLFQQMVYFFCLISNCFIVLFSFVSLSP